MFAKVIKRPADIDMKTLLELEKIVRNAVISNSPDIKSHKITLNTFLIESCKKLKNNG